MPALSHISEDELIRQLTQGMGTEDEVLTGVGDDCAVLKKSAAEHTLLKTDTVVERVHFTAEEDAERVGWKAGARVVSDFASMGGKPEALLVTIILPPETEQVWVEKLYLGLKKVASHFQCSIVGGETSSAPSGSAKVVSVSGTGTVQGDHLTLRSGGNPTDLIYVTGLLGGSLRGKHLDFMPRVAEALWLAEHYKPSAMMDLSDGLAKDLPRLGKSSRCGFALDTQKLPRNLECSPEQALGDGEDYELLFTIPASQQQGLEHDWSQQFPDLVLTCVGVLTQPDAGNSGLLGEDGWDHFQ